MREKQAPPLKMKSKNITSVLDGASLAGPRGWAERVINTMLPFREGSLPLASRWRHHYWSASVNGARW